jgi:DNA-binding beta-propeller fold protein YncE
MQRLFLRATIALLPLMALLFGWRSACEARTTAPREGTSGDTTGAGMTPDTLPGLRVEATGVRYGSGDLREPVGLAADSRGYVYVADAMAGKVFRYSPDGTSLEFERPPDDASFYPIDVTAQESFVFVLDYAANALLRYDYRGAYLDVLISFAGLDLRPVSVSAGAAGRILVTDVANHTVAALTPLLDVELSFGGFGRGPGRFNEPRKAAFLPDHGIAVVESGNRRAQLFFASGAFERVLGPPPGRRYVSPRSVAADARGNVFVADSEAGFIAVSTTAGSPVLVIDSFEGRAIRPSAIALDWSNNLYVADLESRSILVYRLLYPSRE